ncbi:glutamate 5-kinase [Corynebacterium mendelii]|uniref:Glutamate 5-kinase n=1 Tax=Corynebacterium mendelii TaxID=2765362 RepID=A0A939IX74_9CORY|nr:glutamate 5-kinase [Corynebacterium mendelii]MBN9644180.1 glutamate 5-kinase [Corynebacterium mendelii]
MNPAWSTGDNQLPTTPYAPDQTAVTPPPGRACGPAGGIRARLTAAKKVVVKIGSSSLTCHDNTAVDPLAIDRITDALQARMVAGSDVIVVSSGAVAAGMGPLGLSHRPTDLAGKQAAASVGQVHLAHEWGRSFGRYNRTVGQVLLTASDAGIRSRARNAQQTLDRLRQLRAVPIVNENDTVATSEMRFGDNDRLAALVAHLAGADLLVLLSDVDGLYDKNPSDPTARFIPEVIGAGDLNGVVAGGGGKVGTGGMASKVSAAMLATRGGIPVLLTSADKISQALTDASVGTVFHPRQGRLSAWKFWALYAADVTGTLRIDAGAMQAVTHGGASLLAVGITETEGEFHSGDIVEIVGPDGQIIGRGEVAYDHMTLAGMLGKNTADLPEGMQRPVVHADYLSNFATRA